MLLDKYYFLEMRMKAKWLICLSIVLLCLFAILGCSNKKKDVVAEGNAVYYWRTTFRMNDYERNFLKEHNVTKMYLKFFDIVENWDGKIMPVGTTIFIDSIPKDVTIVPTVFITSEAVAKYPEFIDKMYKRVEDMASANGVKYSEIQIDCDWTESTSEQYFAFMKQLRTILEPKGIELSATVRMFQLDYEAPDADYGVLMCYNTGNLKDWETDNSILDIKDVKPYMSKLSGYKLPLSVALPCFSWDVTFGGEKNLLGIEYNSYDFSDKRFSKISENKYEIDKDKERDTYYDYWTPCYVRHEEVSLKDILEVKDMVVSKMSDKPLQMVLYQLDSVNLSKFSSDEVEKIYR